MKHRLEKLRRPMTPQEGRRILGVCAALGNFLGVDPVYVRMAWVLFCLFPPIGTLTAVAVYIVLAFVIPEDRDYIDI